MLKTKKIRNSKDFDVSFEGLKLARQGYDDERIKEIMAEAMKNPNNIEEFRDSLYLDLGDVRDIDVHNKLTEEAWDDLDMVPTMLVELCRDPKYLPFVVRNILGIDLLPYQAAWLDLLWNHRMPMIIGSRGSAKTFIGAIYLTLRAILHQGSRIVVAGAGLRQSMLVFQYIANQIWPKAPILRDICSNREPKKDPTMANWQVGDSQILFIPIGQGDKIRGLRATHIMMEEFASIDPAIYETVIQGFAAVRSQGVKNNVREAYINKYYGVASATEDKPEEIEDELGVPNILEGNQIILSGTPQFTFNHFWDYYRRYRGIILSGGDPDRAREISPDLNLKGKIDSSQYCIIRMPVEALPYGLMDNSIVSQAKALLDPQLYMMEYGACFPADSEGFILASMIASATCPIDGFTMDCRLKGLRDTEYVMGVDPGSEEDNFTINIIELGATRRAVVYQWASTRKDFENLKRNTEEAVPAHINDFVSWCIYQVRLLRRKFNIIRIVLDSSGGGLAIREALKDTGKFLDPSDDCVFDMDDENVMEEEGAHILKMIQFSNKEWRDQSHWGLRQDIIDKRLVFPAYNAAENAFSVAKNEANGIVYARYEDIAEEIEYLKLETIMIKKTITPTGGEKWDVPRIVGVNTDAVRNKLKRDRFTSMLLANWGARTIAEERNQNQVMPVVGGVVGDPNFTSAVAGKRFLGPGSRKMKHNFVEVRHEIIELDSGGAIFY